MCGVIGYQPLPDHYPTNARELFGRLLEQSTIRGKHASGMYQEGHRLIADIDSLVEAFDPKLPMIAHTRYSTSGDWRNPDNNQPIVVDGIALAFNGVIHMGTKKEMEDEHGFPLVTENDGEIFIRYLQHYMAHEGQGPDTFMQNFYAMREDFHWSFSGCWIHEGKLFVGRNSRRPLWVCIQNGAMWLASTRDIFKRAYFLAEPVEVPAA